MWLAWRLWQALGLDHLLTRLLPAGREDVPWATMAAVLVIARLCEPASELHIAEDWFRRTALDDLLDAAETKVNDDRCYRALDRVLEHSQALQMHLKDQLGTLFDLEYDLLLYDITSTYFEGLAEANPLAQRGYSRDHRSACKQVCIGLVVTRDGFPLGFEVFAGNRHDSITLREIDARMEERYGRAQRGGADAGWPPGTLALRGAPRRGPGDPPGSPGARPAATPAATPQCGGRRS